jgi:uncharacterized protein (DUF1778 family)
MANNTSKDERIELRVSAEDKRLFQQAQKLHGDRSFSTFMLRIVRQKSEEIIAQNDRILASERDRTLFFDAVFGDVEPNEALRAASKRYQSKSS